MKSWTLETCDDNGVKKTVSVETFEDKVGLLVRRETKARSSHMTLMHLDAVDAMALAMALLSAVQGARDA